MGEFLNFKEIPFDGKTKRFEIVSATDSNVKLGQVRWYSPWRRYAFYTEKDCFFDTKCLGEIVSFIDVLMSERKNIEINS